MSGGGNGSVPLADLWKKASWIEQFKVVLQFTVAIEMIFRIGQFTFDAAGSPHLKFVHCLIKLNSDFSEFEDTVAPLSRWRHFGPVSSA